MMKLFELAGLAMPAGVIVYLSLPVARISNFYYYIFKCELARYGYAIYMGWLCYAIIRCIYIGVYLFFAYSVSLILRLEGLR